MRKIIKFCRASKGDKLLLGQTFLVMVFVRVSLWLVRFPTLQRWLARLSRPQKDRGDGAKVIWAVRTVSRIVPGATCLTQALVAKALLERRGRTVTLRLGVAKSSHGQFEAHAWLEDEGQVLIGAVKDLRRFTSLPPCDRKWA